MNRLRTPSSFYASPSRRDPTSISFSVCQKPTYFREEPPACVWMRVLITSSGQVTNPESAPAKKPLTRKAL